MLNASQGDLVEDNKCFIYLEASFKRDESCVDLGQQY